MVQDEATTVLCPVKGSLTFRDIVSWENYQVAYISEVTFKVAYMSEVTFKAILTFRLNIFIVRDMAQPQPLSLRALIIDIEKYKYSYTM